MNEAARALARLLHAPTLHFLAIGGLLFALDAGWRAWVEDGEPAPAEALVVSAEQVDQLRQDLTAQNGRRPSAEQLRAAIDAAVDDEVLYREALALGFDRENPALRQRLVQIAGFVADDPELDEEALYQTALDLGLDRSDQVVRRQLAAKMRLVVESLPRPQESPLDDTELEAWLRRHAEQFAQPWQARLTHVYLSSDRRDARTEEDAHELLGQFRAEQIGPEAAPERGDPFIRGHHLAWQTRAELARILGASFARVVPELEPGSWSGPIPSGYGFHLVWVHEVRPGGVPSLASVRDPVRQAVLRDRREQRLREALGEMRARYSVQIEHAPAEAATLSKVGFDD